MLGLGGHKNEDRISALSGGKTGNKEIPHNLANLVTPVRRLSLKENKGKVELLSSLVIKQTTILATSETQ